MVIDFMAEPLYIDHSFIETKTDFRELVSALREGFSNKDTLTPERHHHDFPNNEMVQIPPCCLCPPGRMGKMLE